MRICVAGHAAGVVREELIRNIMKEIAAELKLVQCSSDSFRFEFEAEVTPEEVQAGSSFALALETGAHDLSAIAV